MLEKIINENYQKLVDVFEKLPVSICLVCSDAHVVEKSLDSFFKSRSDTLEINDVLSLGNWEDVIGINSIREIENKITVHPFKKEKYLVIKGAENLTVEALNALLKVIEEPPSFMGVIFATKNWYSLLPTIRSRLLKIKLKLPSAEDIIKALKDRGFSKEEIWKILFISKIDLAVFEKLEDAEIKETLSKNFNDLENDNLMSQEQNPMVKVKRLLFFKEFFFRMISGKIDEKELLRIYEKLSKVSPGKARFRLFIELSRVFFICLRDLIVVIEGVNPAVIYNKDSLGDMLLNSANFEDLVSLLRELNEYLELSYGMVDTRLLLLRTLTRVYLLSRRGD